MASIKEGPFDQPLTLQRRTRELLRKQDMLKVFTATGIPYHWLRKFSAGAYANPSVNRVQFLYEHLTGTKLI